MFDLYAAYYDLLYRDKDYAAESRYVASLLVEGSPQARSVLELGCGTGGHAQELAASGFDMFGVDLSAQMVERAMARREGNPSVASRMHFESADIRDFRARRSFDAVVSLFHVMSYQTRNADVLAALATARAHLQPGGTFVFDCWYGPAVLSDRPRELTKQVRDDRIEVMRRTMPTMYVNDNCVNVRFDIDIVAGGGAERRQVFEDHRMRYFFLPEIEHYLVLSGFGLLGAYTWMTRNPLDDRTWYACIVARAV